MRVWEFAIAATIAEITPGPNMGYLVALALNRGRQAGLAAVAGVALGLSLLGLAAAFGFGLLTQQVPYASEVLRWAGIAYLFWLAVEAWRGTEDAGEGEIALSFRRGLIVNLLNPKAAMFYVAVLPLFLQPSDTGLGSQLWLTALYVIIATAVHTGLVLGAASLRGVFTDREKLVLFQRGAAILMACVALWFAWETRR